MTMAATRTSINHEGNITRKSNDVKLCYATFYGGREHNAGDYLLPLTLDTVPKNLPPGH